MRSNQKMTQKIAAYVKGHQVSLGLFFLWYGMVFLATNILGYWTPSDWSKDLTAYPPQTYAPLLPRSFINPIFFITSFPLLLIGAILLCSYALKKEPLGVDYKQHIAVLLSSVGFTYVVVGAWPLGNPMNFPWFWQKQIVYYGLVFAWLLYFLGASMLVIGAVVLFKYSKLYPKNHPDEYLD
jgi:hypothetical protein